MFKTKQGIEESCMTDIAAAMVQDPLNSAGEYWMSTRRAIKQSEWRLHQSDAILQWCETYGPKPGYPTHRES